MNKKDRSIIIFLSGFILIGIILFIFFFNGTDKYVKKINSEFYALKYKDSINGKILYIEPKHPRMSGMSSPYVILYNFKKIRLEYADNFDYSPHALCDFLQINDSIVKPSYSDTLFVIRNNNIFNFKLGKELNKTKNEKNN